VLSLCRLFVCRLSVTRVYCDKTAEVRIMQFSRIVVRYLIPLPAKFDDKIRRNPSIWGYNYRMWWFQLHCKVRYYRKILSSVCRSFVICDASLSSVISVIRIVTKRLRLELSCFHYKLALHLSYQHITFDDEINRESLRIPSIILD